MVIELPVTTVELTPSTFEKNSKSYTQRPDHITNNEILLWANSRKLSDIVIVTECRFRMAGHVLRLPDHRAAKVAMSWTPADGRHKAGHPKKMWHRTFQQDLQMVNFKWEEVEYVATVCSKWCQAAQSHGRN